MTNTMPTSDAPRPEQKNNGGMTPSIPACAMIAGTLIIVAILLKGSSGSPKPKVEPPTAPALAENGGHHVARFGLAEKVVPPSGVVLPVTWGGLGAKLVESGAIDKEKLISIYGQRNSWTPEYERLLDGQNEGLLKITPDNAGYLLNLFWALGLAQSSPILMEGEMMDKRYGGPDRFASTGGWTAARGNAMDHYSRHDFLALTEEQKVLVEKVSKNIYRPCCGNSTHFPDCNHGLAMLGLLELMAHQGISEADMYRTALTVNSYWFPEQYETIAEYLRQNGGSWDAANPLDILGPDYSSGQGFAKIASEVANRSRGGSVGGSCGI